MTTDPEKTSDLPESDAPPELAPESTPDDLPPAPAIQKDPGAADDSEAERVAAFDSLAEWNGQELDAWTFGRESLFYQHRAAVGAPDIETALSDLDAFLADAARILWLCAHEPGDFRHLRAQPVLMQEAIDEWAETHIPRGRRSAATTIALVIFNDAAANVPTTPDNDSSSGN